MDMQLNMRQSLQLSAQQLRSMEILQMGTRELIGRLDELALENPVIEITPPEYSIRRDWPEPVKDFADSVAGAEYKTTLYEHISEQLNSLDILQAVRKAADFAAQSFNRNGYISESASELAALSGAAQTAMEQALELIRSLDPAGVGARDLGHCLALQLQRIGTDEAKVAADLAMRYLERLAKGQLGYVAAASGYTQEQVGNALSKIRTCDPRPCRDYAPEENIRFIIPDVRIIRSDGALRVEPVDEHAPRLTVNEDYVRIMKATNDSELREYLSDKLRQARWIEGSVKRRQATVLRCAQAIAQKQAAFFTGERAEPSALSMAETAGLIGVNVSTVSRAVRDKYISCDAGVYPMSFFFSHAVSGEYSEHTAIKMVCSIITSEDPKKPLSDQKISELMARQGVGVSRRTVAKYREKQGIPSASARKKM